MNLVSYVTDTYTDEGSLYHISIYDKNTFGPVKYREHLTTGIRILQVADINSKDEIRIFTRKNIKNADNLLVSGKPPTEAQKREVFRAIFEKNITWH